MKTIINGGITSLNVTMANTVWGNGGGDIEGEFDAEEYRKYFYVFIAVEPRERRAGEEYFELRANSARKGRIT